MANTKIAFVLTPSARKLITGHMFRETPIVCFDKILLCGGVHYHVEAISWWQTD